jgi:hypothetical protein
MMLLTGCEKSEDVIEKLSGILKDTQSDTSIQKSQLKDTDIQKREETLPIADASSEEKDVTGEKVRSDAPASKKRRLESSPLQYHKRLHPEAIPSDWYIRLTAEDTARGMKVTSTQLGALAAEDAEKKHTLKSLTPFGGSYLDIVFVDPESMEEGEYKTSFHTFDREREDSWSFVVKTDDTSADITLSWRGIYVLTPYRDEADRLRYKEYRSISNPLIKRMKLVDMETGEELSISKNGKVQSYQFNMNGSETYHFKWVVSDREVRVAPRVKKRKIIESVEESREANGEKINRCDRQKKSESFDLTQKHIIMEYLH